MQPSHVELMIQECADLQWPAKCPAGMLYERGEEGGGVIRVCGVTEQNPF